MVKFFTITWFIAFYFFIYFFVKNELIETWISLLCIWVSILFQRIGIKYKLY